MNRKTPTPDADPTEKAAQLLLACALAVPGDLFAPARDASPDAPRGEALRSFLSDDARRLRRLATLLLEKKGATGGTFLAGAVVEGAQAAGDLATVCSCNADLARDPESLGSALRALHRAVLEMRSLLDDGTPYGDASVRDLRGATWKAELTLEGARPEPSA